MKINSGQSKLFKYTIIACRVYVHKKGNMQRSKFEEMKAYPEFFILFKLSSPQTYFAAYFLSCGRIRDMLL